MRAHLNGSDIREIVNYGISRPGKNRYNNNNNNYYYYYYFIESLAIDWIHGLVYWTDSVLKRIEVSNLNGEKRAIIFSGLHSPRDIVIDPLNRLEILSMGPGGKGFENFSNGSGTENPTVLCVCLFISSFSLG